MITFVITKDDITKTFTCELKDSISIIKNKIIEEFGLKCKYIDLEFILERPIRELGKFNLESGIIPRPLDGYTFDRYGLDDKSVNATFHEVLDYEPKKYQRGFKHVNLSQKYKQQSSVQSIGKKPDGVKFDFSNEDDFPPLS